MKTSQLSSPCCTSKLMLSVLKPQDQFQVYPAAKDSRGICICQDRDYRDVYQEKHGQMALTCPQKRYHLEC